MEWVHAFYQIFKSLSNYVKHRYPQGVTWNNEDGIDAKEALIEVQSGHRSASVPLGGGPPAPPPPPPPLPRFDGPSPPMPGQSRASNGGDMGAVFEQLSKGEGVTAGLRKVDKTEMTHKNPALRAGATVPTRSDSQTSISSASGRGKSPLPGKKPKPESMRTKKPPRKELDGNKWIIENIDNESSMIEVDASISQSILISRCTKAAIRIHNKANAISLDNCSSVSLVIDSLVSSVDVIKSPKFALQVLGNLPTILLDQVDGATIYLGKQSLGTEIFTSKCAGINVNVPGEEEDDDYEECPLPEQIRSMVRNGRVVSEIVEHAG